MRSLKGILTPSKSMNQLPPTNFKTPELHRVERYRVIHEAPSTLYSPQEGDPQLSIHAVSSNASSDEKPKQRKRLVEFSPQVETDLRSVPLKRGAQAAKQERDSPVTLEVEECTPSLIVVTDCNGAEDDLAESSDQLRSLAISTDDDDFNGTLRRKLTLARAQIRLLEKDLLLTRDSLAFSMRSRDDKEVECVELNLLVDQQQGALRREQESAIEVQHVAEQQRREVDKWSAAAAANNQAAVEWKQQFEIVVKQLAQTKVTMAEYQGVLDCLGLRHPFSDEMLRCAVLRLQNRMPLPNPTSTYLD